MMPETWKDSRLEDIASKDYGMVDGPFGSNLPASLYVNDGIPVVRGSNLSLGEERFKADEFVFVSEETYKQLERSACKPGDIIFTKKGTLGQTGIVPNNIGFDKFLISSNQMKLTVDSDIADPLFVYYYVSSSESRDRFVRESTASGVPKTNLSYLRKFPIVLPPLPEQRAIARILGSLDDKIELNRRMNHTLEEMARALFKSWFVDFDPVTAKAEGRVPYSMNAETASLFPAEFVERLDEQIPLDWEVGSILSFSNLLSGGTPSTHKSEYWDGEIAWVSAKDVSSANGLFLLSTERSITHFGLENSSAKLLPAKTTIVTARGTVGKYCLLGHEMSMNQTNYGLRAKDDVSHFFTYFSLVFLVEQLQQNSYGTIFDTITTRTFQDSHTIIPPKKVIDAFEKRVTPMMNMILDNTLQAQTLTSIRDALLPKLMSGELRVKQAEKIIQTI